MKKYIKPCVKLHQFNIHSSILAGSPTNPEEGSMKFNPNEETESNESKEGYFDLGED